MSSLSTSMEDVKINKGECYFLIDSLYIDDIKPVIDSLNIHRLEEDIRQKAFPYNDIPFAKFKATDESFGLKKIRSVEYGKIEKGDLSAFSSDTGMVHLINEKIFIDVVRVYDYGELVDSIKEPINKDYWNHLAAQFKEGDIALILSPGLGFAVDFSGGGSYQIIY